MNLKRRGEKRWPSKLLLRFDSRLWLHGFNNLQALSFTVLLRLLRSRKASDKGFENLAFGLHSEPCSRGVGGFWI
jgi:hypothetical protein